MKYKHFPAPFFKRLIEPRSPTIAKLNSLHGVSRGQLPHKIGPISLWFAPPPPPPHFITSKSSNPYALPNPINMTTMIRQNIKVSPYC